MCKEPQLESSRRRAMPNRGVFACSRPGTEGSNPAPSSAKSVANLTFGAHPIDGGPYSASLAKVGADVIFVARGAHLAAMRENGLHIKGDRGENQPSLY